MSNYNKVILIGNLTRDPELRFAQSGKAICAFGLAINRKWTSETGEKKEEATFVDVTAFGKTGETIAQYVKKGSGLMVEGRLRLEQWDDKQSGQKRQKLSVLCEAFQFVGGKGEASQTERGQSGARQTQAVAQPDDGGSDPVPF